MTAFGMTGTPSGPREGAPRGISPLGRFVVDEAEEEATGRAVSSRSTSSGSLKSSEIVGIVSNVLV